MIGIEAQHIIKTYSRNEAIVLNDISFEFFEKEKIGILGPNGAGKTSLISILCGILGSNEGSVVYKKKSKEINCAEFKRELGFVPQDLALYQELSPIQNLKYFGRMYNMSKTKIDSKSEEVLELLGLYKVKDKKVKSFSGGMKRRLNLAISILHDPKILFLDEPTVGIDVQSKNAIIQLLNQLNNNGTTIIYTSHHLNEAEHLCDKVLLIDQGNIIAFDTVDQLKKDHALDTLEEVFLKLTGIAYRD